MAVGVKIPENARIIRNLLMGAQFQHDHVVHFYHLHALDWVDVVAALGADQDLTQRLLTCRSARAGAWSVIFSSVRRARATAAASSPRKSRASSDVANRLPAHSA